MDCFQRDLLAETISDRDYYNAAPVYYWRYNQLELTGLKQMSEMAECGQEAEQNGKEIKSGAAVKDVKNQTKQVNKTSKAKFSKQNRATPTAVREAV